MTRIDDALEMFVVNQPARMAALNSKAHLLAEDWQAEIAVPLSPKRPRSRPGRVTDITRLRFSTTSPIFVTNQGGTRRQDRHSDRQ